MKLIIVLSTLAAAVFAHDLQMRDMPPCAIPCIRTALQKMGTCKPVDMQCFCDNFEQISKEVEPCVIERCGERVAREQVLPAAMALCIGHEDPSPPGTANHTGWASIWG